MPELEDIYKLLAVLVWDFCKAIYFTFRDWF